MTLFVKQVSFASHNTILYLLTLQSLLKHYNFASKPCFNKSFQLLVSHLTFNARLLPLLFPFT
jgi:hypothetical protein